MSLIITSPKKTINNILTDTLAIESQARYPITIQDGIISAADDPDAGPATRVRFTLSPDPTSFLTDGQSVYIRTVLYTGLFVVETVTATSFIITAPFLGTTTGDYRVLQTAYRIEVEIRDSADTFTVGDTTFKYVPPQNGQINIDLSNVVNTYMKFNGVFSFQFFARFTEVWEGSSEATTTTDTMQGLDAFKQVGLQGGALTWENYLGALSPFQSGTYPAMASDISTFFNLRINDPVADVTGEFEVGDTVVFINNAMDQIVRGLVTSVIFDTHTRLFTDIPFAVNASNNGIIGHQPRLLTVFTSPVIWRGWNRTAVALIDSNMENRLLPDIVIRPFLGLYNVNKVSTGIGSGSSFINAPPGVHIQDLNEFEFILPDTFYRGIYFGVNQSSPVSETLLYLVADECPNPVMLDWINSVGGIEQHLFSINQLVVVDSGQGVIIERSIDEDFADVVRTKRRFKGPTIQRMTLLADDLTIDQLRGLQEIKDTISLRCYLTRDGSEFIDVVVVEDYTIEYSTVERGFSYTLTIEFPDNYDFFKAKLY